LQKAANSPVFKSLCEILKTPLTMVQHHTLLLL
jgi:hypothetical protein